MDLPTPPMDESGDSTSSFVAIACFELFLGVIGVAVGWWFGFDPRHDAVFDLARGVSWDQIGNVILGVVSTVPLFVGFGLIERSNWKPVVEIRGFVDSTIYPLIGAFPIPVLVLLGLIAGAGEELLFRGAVQFLLTEWTTVVVAVLVTSVLFGAAHAVTRAYAIIAGLASLYLGLLFAVSGSLILVIVAHAVYDIVALIYIARIRQTPVASAQKNDASSS